jgi:hypothetical protein
MYRFKFFPDPPVALINISRIAPTTENTSLQILFKYPTLVIIFRNTQNPYVFLITQYLAPASQNDASTSKSGAYMSYFINFKFEICFAPQRRTLFRHLNFQKCSEPVSFFTLLTSKCASRHNGV